jgi:1-deoxy-D-xylulose-5-phosphate reductoisomerase
MRLAILGSTGSIGCSALAVVDAHPDRLTVVGLAAGTGAPAMAQQIARYRPRMAVMASDAACDALRAQLPTGPASPAAVCGAGPQALIDLVTRDDVDTVLCASSGTAALEAVVAAIRAGKRIALANKEVLVMAGRLVMDLAREHGVEVLPVDSEHNAIHQCLHRRDRSEVRRLILTASSSPA